MTPIPQHLQDRMVAVIRILAECEPIPDSRIDLLLVANARAIVADLPKPTDPDLIIAREVVAADWGPHDAGVAKLLAGESDRYSSVRIALAAIKRVRDKGGAS